MAKLNSNSWYIYAIYTIKSIKGWTNLYIAVQMFMNNGTHVDVLKNDQLFVMDIY